MLFACVVCAPVLACIGPTWLMRRAYCASTSATTFTCRTTCKSSATMRAISCSCLLLVCPLCSCSFASAVKCVPARTVAHAVCMWGCRSYVIGVPLGAYVMLSLALKSHLYGKDQLAAELEWLLKRAGTKPNHEDANEIKLVRDHLKELQETSLTQYKKRLGVVEAHFEPKPQPKRLFLTGF